uniref:Uncharacterized protein n=1 Tax=Anguilla anguilla TaxID=7936 RepID=A0A0E9SJ83_ANGAN
MQDSPTVLQMCQMKGLMGHLKCPILIHFTAEDLATARDTVGLFSVSLFLSFFRVGFL